MEMDIKSTQIRANNELQFFNTSFLIYLGLIKFLITFHLLEVSNTHTLLTQNHVGTWWLRLIYHYIQAMDAQLLDNIKILLQSSNLEKWGPYYIPKHTDLVDSLLLLLWRLYCIQSVISLGCDRRLIQHRWPVVEGYVCVSLKAAAK